MRIAVTGCSGLLGTQLLRRLIDDRKVEQIVALDLRPPRLISKKLQFVRADVRDEAIAEHFKGCDALVHLAFLVVQRAPRGFLDSVNVGGSKNVFNAAAGAGLKTIVYTSSVAAYGVVSGHPTPIVEETPRIFQPGFAYSAAKYQVEEFLDQFEPAHPDISVCRLRPSVLIGEGMDHPLGASLKGGVLPDFGAKTLPVVWNEDVADAIVLALQQRARGAFILCAAEQKSAAELCKAVGLRHMPIKRSVALLLARVSPLLARLKLMAAIDPAWIVSNDAEMTFFSDKAKRELGWKPRCATSIEVMQRYVDTVPGSLDRGLRFFVRLVDLAGRLQPPRVELKGFRSRINLALTGPGGGDIDITVEGGKIRARPGMARPPDAIITLPAALLLDLLAGRSDFATAQLTGRMRVEGQGHAVLVLGGIISQLRTAASAKGSRGRVGRWVTGLIASRSQLRRTAA